MLVKIHHVIIDLCLLDQLLPRMVGVAHCLYEVQKFTALYYSSLLLTKHLILLLHLDLTEVFGRADLLETQLRALTEQLLLQVLRHK